MIRSFRAEGPRHAQIDPTGSRHRVFRDLNTWHRSTQSKSFELPVRLKLCPGSPRTLQLDAARIDGPDPDVRHRIHSGTEAHSALRRNLPARPPPSGAERNFTESLGISRAFRVRSRRLRSRGESWRTFHHAVAVGFLVIAPRAERATIRVRADFLPAARPNGSRSPISGWCCSRMR